MFAWWVAQALGALDRMTPDAQTTEAELPTSSRDEIDGGCQRVTCFLERA